MPVPWSDAENDAIVADYFAMLAQDAAGRAYSKAAHRRALVTRIGRAEGSVEYKHQNISAVLKGLGEDWIAGYKPAFNFQWSLVDAVARWLARNPDWVARTPERNRITEVREANAAYKPLSLGGAEAPLWIGPPPTHSNAPPPDELAQMMAVAARFDVAERDARNRALGRAGEARIVASERATLAAAGRADLAARVRWVADEDGDGAGYDVASFEPDGTERLIEVKTTNGWERTPFHLTSNEIAVAETRRDVWQLIRLWNFARQPRAFAIRPPLDAHVSLMPTSFLAALR